MRRLILGRWRGARQAATNLFEHFGAATLELHELRFERAHVAQRLTHQGQRGVPKGVRVACHAAHAGGLLGGHGHGAGGVAPLGQRVQRVYEVDDDGGEVGKECI